MEFLDRGGYSRWFVERLLIPQVSAVWSADPEELGDFPAAFLAQFLANHGALQFLGRPRWRSITGGSRAYVERRTTEGLSKKEILRCLKRYIARELYPLLAGNSALLTLRRNYPAATPAGGRHSSGGDLDGGA